MPHEDYLIFVFLKRNLKYKSIFMFGYIRPNIVIKALWEVYKTLLYIVANVLIKPNWQSLTKLVNENANNDYENDNVGQIFFLHNSNKFKEIIEKNFWRNIGTKHIES